MKRFADLGIDVLNNKNIFQVPVVSISDLVNCEIEILDFEKGVKTKHGEDRYVVKIRFEGEQKKFFTNATPIKEALHRIPKDSFPFLATIKQQRYGTGRTFYFV